MSNQKIFHLAVAVECVLDKQLCVRAHNLDEAQSKAVVYLDFDKTPIAMRPIEKSISRRQFTQVKISLIDCDDGDFSDEPDDDRLSFTHVN